MRMWFIRGLHLQPALSNVLLSRQELMGCLMLLVDLSVIPAKVVLVMYIHSQICIVHILNYCIAAIHNLASKYREEYNMPNLKIPYNIRQGFYFIIPQKDITGRLPNKFIQVYEHHLTKQLVSYNMITIICLFIIHEFLIINQVVRHGKNVHCSSLELASVS